jgi:hypothetical protein
VVLLPPHLCCYHSSSLIWDMLRCSDATRELLVLVRVRPTGIAGVQQAMDAVVAASRSVASQLSYTLTGVLWQVRYQRLVCRVMQEY